MGTVLKPRQPKMGMGFLLTQRHSRQVGGLCPVAAKWGAPGGRHMDHAASGRPEGGDCGRGPICSEHPSVAGTSRVVSPGCKGTRRAGLRESRVSRGVACGSHHL